MPITDNSSVDADIRRAQRGDLRAFEEIVRRFESPLRAWVAAHCPPGGDADDVAQRTFLSVFQRLGEFEPGTNFSAWLFTIARYQLMTETTRLRRLADYHSRYTPELLAIELDRRVEQPAEALAGRLQHLRGCIGELGDNGRRFIHWRYTDEMPLQEMASRTNRSVAAIKKQLWILRQKLQECIEHKLTVENGGAA